MNQRAKASAYHVTPEFLENAWIGYSYEFTAYVDEFCERLPGDPQFVFRAGMEKASSMMQVLARPFSLAQIYGMVPYFGNKVASGSVECRVVEVTPISAALAMRFSGCTLRQFGPYRRRCAQVKVSGCARHYWRQFRFVSIVCYWPREQNFPVSRKTTRGANGPSEGQ